jgi:photosystem II stability/assembly factor-like uncharacterized protein
MILRVVILSILLPVPGSMLAQPPDSLSWVRTGGPPGGLGYDIRYNFADPDTWYATDNYGGVHISTDNGVTWQPSNNGIQRQSGPSGDAVPIFCLTVDPLDPAIVWTGTAGTGHIYKSTDGGRSWVQKDEGVTIEYDVLTFRGFTVDPRSSNIVYAMGETKRFEPRDSTSVPTGGVVYRTTDGGEHWALIWDGDIPSSLTRYLWIDPRDPDVLYVSTGIFDSDAVGQSVHGDWETDPDPFGGLGILKSTDGGQTWRELNKANGLNFLYIGSLFMHPDNADTLLAAAGHVVPAAALQHMMTGGPIHTGIYRTTDGGENWTHVLKPPPERAGEVFSAVELSSSQPDIGYAGSNQAVYRTEDAGETWTLVAGGASWGSPGVVAGTPIDLQCDPRDPNRLFANNYQGGNFLSEDGGKTWKNASKGYTGAQVVSVAVDPSNPGRVYSSGRNGVWRSDDGGAFWYGIRNFADRDSPEWGGIADPTQSDRLLVGGDTVFESVDGGASWQPLLLPQPFRPLTSVIVFAPSDPKIIYAGAAGPQSMLLLEVLEPAGGLVVSHDGGATWQSVVGDQLTDTPILGLSVDAQNPQVVFAATAKGLYRTTNGGTSWTLMSGLPGGSPVHSVAVDPLDSQHALAGTEYGGLFVSHNGGSTWQQVSAGLEPNASYRDIVFDPTDPNVIYLGDLVSGVYRSPDRGESWVKIISGLSTRAIASLAISADGQHLYAATNGEGVFRLDLSGVPVSADVPEAIPTEFGLEQNYPNPFNPVTVIRYTLRQQAHVNLRIANLLGEEVITLIDKPQNPGSYSANWNGKDKDGRGVASGVYLYRLEAGGVVDVKKMLFIK